MLGLLYEDCAEQVWNICGDFGLVQGQVEKKKHLILSSNEKYEVTRTYHEDESGVISIKGCFLNRSAETMRVCCLMNRFYFDGGEYEVYTQRNSWQNESYGSWQPLVTEISAETKGLRNAYGAVPFFCVWNQQTNRGIAFHILTKFPWKFTVRYVPAGGEWNFLEIEAGINNYNYQEEVSSGEQLEIPQMLMYEIESKREMDCFKLHKFLNKYFPRKDIPVIYNTWMYQFEKINYENVKAQINRAAELGVDYFVIDAAWFSNGNFWEKRGDWKELTDGVFEGRMLEISDEVRLKGMKFGFWLEIETIGAGAEFLKEHQDFYFTFYINGNPIYFYDFANVEAREYLYKVVSGLIDKYDASFIKFDFNQDLSLDYEQQAYRKYFEGYQCFIHKLRTEYPELYMENCASGGLRMTVADSMDFDGFWLSDNASPYEGVRILKETVLRMAPQMIERWAMIQSVEDFKHCYANNPREKLIALNDATWLDVRGVNLSYLKGFLTGGPIGFSCDLNSLSQSAFDDLKNTVISIKKEKEFWKNAVCRILSDTESVTVLEYHNSDFSKIELIIYTNRISQCSIAIYPLVDERKTYSVNEKFHKGVELKKKGIKILLEGNYMAKRVSLASV